MDSTVDFGKGKVKKMPCQVKCHNCGAILYTEENSSFMSWGMNTKCSVPPVTNWLIKNVPKTCPHCGCKLATVPLTVEAKPMEKQQ